MKTRISIGCLLVLLCSACQSGQEKKLDPYELIITPRNENLPEIKDPANLDKIGGFRNLKLNTPLDMHISG